MLELPARTGVLMAACRHSLRLVCARASALAVFVSMGIVIVLIDLGIPLRSLQILAFGAVIAAWGFHNWAEDALEDYEKAVDEAEGKDEMQ